MQRLMEYAAAVDPGFASRIEGASPAEIERLERVAGGPLPSDYRTFLDLMGRRDDAILGQDDIVTSADTLADFYDESVATGERSVPPGFITFAISGLSIGQLFVDRNPPHPVYQQAGKLWATSFRGLLYQKVFEKAVHRNHSIYLVNRDTTPRLADAQTLLETLGLQRLWFSDEVTLCHESADDKVLIRQFEGRRARLLVSSRRLLRRWSLTLRLARELHFFLFSRPIPRGE